MEKDPFEKRIKPVTEDAYIKGASSISTIKISPWKLTQYFEDQIYTNPYIKLLDEKAPDVDPAEQKDNKCDYTIVLYHGGKEYYRYPSPNLQRVCRYMIEKGTDLVICQHSHCIGCEENYLSGKIVYGQGNFIFDCDDR